MGMLVRVSPLRLCEMAVIGAGKLVSFFGGSSW